MKARRGGGAMAVDERKRERSIQTRRETEEQEEKEQQEEEKLRRPLASFPCSCFCISAFVFPSLRSWSFCLHRSHLTCEITTLTAPNMEAYSLPSFIRPLHPFTLLSFFPLLTCRITALTAPHMNEYFRRKEMNSGVVSTGPALANEEL